MASGLLGFLGFGRKSKPNLTQAYKSPPSAESAPLYGDLRNLASRRISGQDVGFGEDFVNKSTNAQAKRMRADYEGYVSPALDAELSKRGVARSAGPGLATDIKTRALQTNQSDIDQLMERFFVLNEAQKKTDVTEGIRVGDQLNTQYLNQGNEAASQFNAAERGNTERTAGVAAANNAADRSRQNQTLQAAGSLAGDFFGSNAGQGMLKSLGLEGFAKPNSSKVNLGNSSFDKSELLKLLLA